MKLTKLTTFAAATLLLVAASNASALSSTVNYGGVTWDTDSGFDFSAQSNINLSNLDNNELSGFGIITGINNNPIVCVTCELTFTFKYDLVSSGDANSDGIADAVFDNGVVDFFVDTSLDYNSSNVATAGNGVNWLSLEGVSTTGIGGVGELFATLSSGLVFDGNAAGSSLGLLNVVGGLASMALDTDGQALGADLAFTSSFQPTNGSVDFPFLGTAEFSGASVPAPLPIALLGLGLLGLVVAKRKTKA